MLNSHAEIATPPEFHFVSQYIVKHPNLSIKKMVQMLSNDSRFARLGLTIDEVTKPFINQKVHFSTSRLYQFILKTYAAKRGINIIGDKAPINVEYLPVIHRIYPEAIVIHIIRDPRDVYLSRTKAKWSSSRSDTLQFLAYRTQYDLGHSLGPKLFGNNYLEVHYENLITQPITELKRICDLLGVCFDGRMLNFSSSAKELVGTEEMSWKRETFGPLLAKNMNKWKKELSPLQIVCIEAACSPVFKSGFYKCTRPLPQNFSRVIVLFINVYMPFLATTYKFAVALKNRNAIRTIN